jgi:hypothetical protein
MNFGEAGASVPTSLYQAMPPRDPSSVLSLHTSIDAAAGRLDRLKTADSYG